MEEAQAKIEEINAFLNSIIKKDFDWFFSIDENQNIIDIKLFLDKKDKKFYEEYFKSN